MTRAVKRLLLLAHATPWRARFGEEYLELLDRKPLDAFDILDGIQSSVQSHARVQTWGPLALAAASAVFSGVAALHDSRSGAAAAVIVTSSFALTTWKPQHWWLWLLVAGMSVPSAYALVDFAHVWADHAPATFAGRFAAFIPATIAGVVGMCVRISVALYGCRKARMLESK